MTLTVTLTEAADVRLLQLLFAPCHADPASTAPPPWAAAIILELKEMRMTIKDSTDKAAAVEAKVDSLTQEIASLKDRVTAADAAKDAALKAANDAKDFAVSALTAAQVSIAELQAASAANPADTSAIDVILDRMSGKLDGDVSAAKAIDPATAPVATEPAASGGGTTGTTGTTGTSTGQALPDAPELPDAPDVPNAPAI